MIFSFFFFTLWDNHLATSLISLLTSIRSLDLPFPSLPFIYICMLYLWSTWCL
ncbi:hypothetical protein OIU76_022442 [Salix suchowensis]|nr:hypothetical protein OIU76_022442 [Salix suchowensis]